MVAAATAFAATWPAGIQAATPQQALNASAAGFAWLISGQNVDGSWGQGDSKMLYTSEAVAAFWAQNRKDSSYQRGVAWLENHSPSSIDEATRRFRALNRNRAQVESERQAILGAKVIAAPPMIQRSGWGIAADYWPDPLDTALVLIALGEDAPQTFFPQHADAVDELILSLTSGGAWTIGQGVENPGTAFKGDFLTTVTVTEALRICRTTGHCGTPQTTTSVDIDIWLAELQMAAWSGFADDMGKALLARYFGRFDGQLLSGSTTIAGVVLDRLLAAQNATSGSWSNDVLVTATALQAFGAWLDMDATGQDVVVSISDPALRRAVNRALGKSAMDQVTQAEIRDRLTALDASYAPIASFSALGGAPNLRQIDISGNPCLVNNPNINATLMLLFPSLQTIIKRPLGDVNLDNHANSFDDSLLANGLLGWISLNSNQRRAGDLNFDDRLDSRDLYWMGRVLLNQDVSSLCP